MVKEAQSLCWKLEQSILRWWSTSFIYLSLLPPSLVIWLRRSPTSYPEHQGPLIVCEPELRRLTAFRNCCTHVILGFTKFQQRKERITTAELASQFGTPKTIDDMLVKHQQPWLDHLGCMGPNRLPKQVLLGELTKVRPQHRPTGIRCRKTERSGDESAQRA